MARQPRASRCGFYFLGSGVAAGGLPPRFCSSSEAGFSEGLLVSGVGVLVILILFKVP